MKSTYASLFATTALTAIAFGFGAHAQGAAPASRQAWFGDLHLHTSYSFDAWAMMGTKITPDEAYHFAKGETITYLGKQVHRADPPLDFLAVTDHSEYIGVMRQLDDPNSSFAQSEVGKKIKANPVSGFMSIFHANGGSAQIGDFDATPVMRDAWQREQDAANANYQPGKFTTFIAYEWTSMPKGRYNLHRNVIFSGDHAPYPFTSRDSQRPDDLWTYLEKARSEGSDVIDIPHNSNASGGLMFDWVNSDGKPIDEAYALRRVSNEPLVEIYQNKGGSETHPELSSADEFSNFEVMDKLLIRDVKSAPPGSYVRDAEGRGLVIQQKIGVNPYKLGYVGASDFHNGLSTSREDAFAGFVFGVDPKTTLPDTEAAKKVLSPQPALIPEDPDAAEASNIPTPVIPDLPYNPGKFSDPTEFGSGRADRRLGGGKYAGVDLCRVPPQGNLRDIGNTHPHPLLRKLELCSRAHQERQLGRDRLRERRSDGRRSSRYSTREGRAAICRLGHQGSGCRQSRPHPDHQALDRRRQL